MGYLNNTGLSILWNKIKATFGVSLDVSNATITLKNGAATPTSLSQVTIPDATSSTPGVMTAAMVTKLNGIATGATAVSESTVSGWGFTKSAGSYSKPSGGIPKSDLASAVQTSLGKADTALQSHQDISGKADKATTLAGYGITDAKIANGVITLGSSTITPITSHQSLSNYYTKSAADTAISNAIATAQVGAAMFKGTANANTAISNTAYKKGMYWVVATAGTYVGQTCEVGDMIFCIKDKGSAYAASDFSVIQNNIVEMTTAEIDAICV